MTKNHRERLTARVSLALAVVAVGYGMASLTLRSANRVERAECVRWRQTAEELPVWASTAWQREQCDALQLPLPR